MKVIIPMAGMGTRMRPHTLVTPKPLLKIAGKSIIERIINDLFNSTGKHLDEIHFVVGNFGTVIETELLKMANGVNSTGFIHYQTEALGTAHAIFCAKEALTGEVIITFADTLFDGDLTIGEQEAIIWTKEVQNPENYGIAVTDTNGIITKFVEKPKQLISNNAIIGIYYFKKGEILRKDIDLLIKNKVSKQGEFQLTDSLENLLLKGTQFSCKSVNAWLDCGNKSEFLKSNSYFLSKQGSVVKSKVSDNSFIENPVYIGNNVLIENCNIGPNVSIDDNCKLINSKISNCIVRADSYLENCELVNSMIGMFVKIKGLRGIVNLGDYVDYEAV
jgi:glucose-1-phosphate thymidylyltransferase